MRWPRIPNEDALEEVALAYEHGGHDFWSLTDTPPAYAGYRCSCGGDFTKSETCLRWACRRESKQCLAAKGTGERCSDWALPRLFLCNRHWAKAWPAIVAATSTEAQRQLDASLASVQSMRAAREAEMERMLLGLGFDQAVIWDAATAASRLAERVYFYAVVDANVVKIGRSINVAQRVRTLRGTKAPDGVDVSAGELLGTIPGGSRVEGELHGRFRGHRLVGEWFALQPIRDEIDGLLSEYGEAAA